MHRRLALQGAVVGWLAAGCEGPAVDSPDEEIRQRLVGTWLREYGEEGTRVRRLLVLGPDGRFRETARIRQPNGSVTEVNHAGEWGFDGTNLKRRYTSFDGKKPAAPAIPFLALELKWESGNVFVGVDHVHRHKVQYRRVESETEP